MFDDVKKEPEDIFSETDKSAPQVTAPTDQVSAPAAARTPIPTTPQVVAQAPSSSQPTAPASFVEPRVGVPWKAILIILLILVIVGVAFFISYRILSSKTPTTPLSPTELDAEVMEEESAITEEEPEEEAVVVEEEEEKPEVDLTDSDKDGLTDEEEKEIGTSPLSADTDGDGLFDYEEVNTWGTNPLKADTDGDGFDDGDEVSNGYDPNGDGTLLTIPTKE